MIESDFGRPDGTAGSGRQVERPVDIGKPSVELVTSRWALSLSLLH